MRSPVLAMLWENWRLTRVEAAQRLCLGLVAGSAVLVLDEAGSRLAFWLLLSLHAMFWMSIAKLNGGRFLDGYRPGFPFYLLYTLPVRTVVLVGVAMAYDAIFCAASYVLSAALLGFAFSQPLPLLSVAAWIVAFHLISTCVQWSTRNRVVQWLGSGGICLPFFVLLMFRQDRSATQLEFSLAEYAVMASSGVVAFGLTVAGVARQRRGDAVAAKPRTAAHADLSDWLINQFRFTCPISSATLAQIWFDLTSSGLPVLAIGGALAIANLLLFAVSSPIDDVLRSGGFYIRPIAQLSAIVFAMLSVLTVLVLGGNAFGIRARQGRRYASAFAATQAYGTAQMACLKVFVRAGCVLAALIALGVSFWASVSFTENGHDLMTGTDGPLTRVLRAIAAARLTGYEQLALAVVTAMGVAIMVASRAALAALRARYPRRLFIAGSLLLLHGLVLVLVALAVKRGLGSEFLLDAILGATKWIAAAASVLATVYLFWSVFAERVLTLRHAWGVLLVSAAFGAAWVSVLRTGGVQIAAMPTTDAAWMLLPALLPLTASVLAPWALNRVRHV